MEEEEEVEEEVEEADGEGLTLRRRKRTHRWCVRPCGLLSPWWFLVRQLVHAPCSRSCC